MWFPALSQVFTKITNSALNKATETLEPTWCDYDGDGDMDVFINARSAVTNASYFFQNNCNGDFSQITAIPGNITTDRGSWQSSWIDYNNDGFSDLYVSHYGRPKSLYKNNGDGTFIQIMNLNIVADSSFTRGNAWADYNNDGNLDLFLCNDGGSAVRQNDKLFLSNGNGDIINDHARSQSAEWGDYDNDGYMDLFVSAISTQNLFYHNNGDGTFTRVLNDVLGTSYSRTWSSQWVDINNDGNLDLFQHNSFGQLNYVFHNNGNGTFTSITNNALCFATLHNNGGSSWGDYDNDGDMDVFISSFYGNKLYSNDGAGDFTEVTNEVVSQDIIVESYGATWIDYDNNGTLDLFVSNAYGAPESFLYFTAVIAIHGLILNV